MSAPRRLLDDPSVSGALREDLRRAAEAEPSYDGERGLRALQAAIVTLGPASQLGDAATEAGSHAAEAATQAGATQAGATQAAASGALAGGKLTIAAVATVVGLGVAGAVALLQRAPEEPAVAKPAMARPAAEARIPQVEVPVVEAPVEPAAEPAVEPPSAVEPAAATPETSPSAPVRHAHKPSAPSDPDLALRREIEHLARVKALLPGDPRAAYALAQQGNRTLGSMLRQERDGLSVLALDAAGDRARAARLGRELLHRHPNSPFRERIEQLLAQPRGAQ